jgi:hypothetical protein
MSTTKKIYLEDSFVDWFFEQDIKDRTIDLHINHRNSAIENLGSWLPISYITNWEEIKPLLNEVDDEEHRKLGDYFEDKMEIDWRGGLQSTFGKYTFELDYESDKDK